MPLNADPTLGWQAGLFVADYPANGLLTTNAVNNLLNPVEIPQVVEITPEGTAYGDKRESHLKTAYAVHQFGAGWGDPRTVTFRQLYTEVNKAFLFTLEPRAYVAPLGAAPAGVPVPRGGKAPNGAVYTQADAPLVHLDLYLWVRVYPDGSKVGFFGFLAEHGETGQNTEDNAVETAAVIRVSGKPLFVQVP